MQAGQQLHELIHSLSQTEKRYFKLYASRHTIGQKNNSVKLFDIMEKATEYDEKKLKKQLYTEPTIYKYLSSERAYLRKLILESLHLYNAENIFDVKLSIQLHQAIILIRRGLFGQAGQLLRKIKQEAYPCEAFLILLEVIKWESELMRINSYYGVSKKMLDQLKKEETSILKKLENLKCLQHILHDISFLLNKAGAPRNMQEQKKYRTILNSPVFKNESALLSLSAKLQLYQVYILYYLYGDKNMALYKKYHLKTIELLEKNKGMMPRAQNIYITTLLNLSNTYIETAEYDKFFSVINKLQDLDYEKKLKSYPKLRTQIPLIIELGRMEVHNRLGNFDKSVTIGKGLLVNQKKEIEKLEPRVNMVFCHQTAYAYFGTGNYRLALSWFNNIAQKFSPYEQMHLYGIVKILLLITHLELGNETILPYVIKSTHRFLFRKEKLFLFESLVLKYIKKFAYTIGPKKQRKLYKDFKQEMEQVFKDPLEKKALDYFDFSSWLESKIEKQPFAEIIKKKRLK